MGCYGIGVSRLLAAIIEHGCTFKEEQLLWPSVIAPYFACIAPLTTSKASTPQSHSLLFLVQIVCLSSMATLGLEVRV